MSDSNSTDSSAAGILQGAVPQIEALLKQAAADFQANNGAATKQLGFDVVAAIFATQVATYFPALADLAANATAQDIAARSDQELARTNMFAVVAEAEKEHYATIHALKLSAINEVTKISTGILAIVGGFAVKFLATVKL